MSSERAKKRVSENNNVDNSTVMGGLEESAADPELAAFDPADMISYSDPKQIEDGSQYHNLSSGNDFLSTIDSFDSNISTKEINGKNEKDFDDVSALMTEYYEKGSFSSASPKLDHTKALSEISQTKSDNVNDHARYLELTQKMRYIEMLLSNTKNEIMSAYGKYIPNQTK